ncbi:SRPBCC family protein [Nocardia sp. CA-136227]|uniref:SRPBCC family protein n=1 Tax=Nocardia sp. CA-136227 TaxID=3239979 RepID=UPI003D95A8FC
MNAPAATVFANLERGAFAGLPALAVATYPTTDRGAGTSRTAHNYVFAALEQVIDHHPDEHLHIAGVHTSISLLVDSYAQEYRLTPSANGTRIEWTISGRPGILASFPLTWTAPFIRPFARPALRRSATPT